MDTSTKTKRRYEPDRRDRIIDVTLDVIAQYGVAGTTHRRVAEAADVPLGAMTYYFKGMDDLLQQAFTRLAETMSLEFQQHLAAATTREQACQVIIDWACDGLWTNERNLVLIFELSALAARRPNMRPLVQRWMGVTADYLHRYFSPTEAKLLDAFIDGLLIRNIVSPDNISREEVTLFVQKVTLP